MVALRRRPVGAFSRPLVLSALCAAFTPTSIGYQDLAALIAHQRSDSARWHEHLIASPFGTIHAAIFSFTRPIGTAVPGGVQSVNFDPRSFDVKAWSGEQPVMARPVLQIEYPTVNRRLKGDRMPFPQSAPAMGDPASLPPLLPAGAPSSSPADRPAPFFGSRPKAAEQTDPPLPAESTAIDAFGTLQARAMDDQPASPVRPGRTLKDKRYGAGEANGDAESGEADVPPEAVSAGESEAAGAPASPFASPSFFDEDAAERNAQLYFGVAVMGAGDALLQWQPGTVPVPVPPAVNPDLKLSAFEQRGEAGPGGETVAGKGNTSLFKSPADRLGLSGRSRVRAEKCIADAVYFEARGEPLRGQMAVAQVVMNRVFSGRYPNDVCGVVFQNANRHLACQFTFACEHKDLSRIDEPDMWEQAKRIAKDTLDGKIWLPELGHATHYHAYWVHPSWVHEMVKLYKLGVHTFYRPRAWGDGSDAPIWSSVPVAPKPAGATAQDPGAPKGAAAASANSELMEKVPQAAASPELVSDKNPRTAKL